MMLPDDLRNALKSDANSIPAILEHLGVDVSRLPPHGGLICDPRPGHEESNPSFSISRGADGVDLWSRFGGDGKSGNGYHLLLEFGFAPSEAAQVVKDRAGMTKPFNTRAQSISEARESTATLGGTRNPARLFDGSRF
jgi:hypothetical protein